MKLIQILNPEGVTEAEVASYRIRTAVRAIVYDKDGDIGVLNVSKRKYHKLPGGGVNDGEDINSALKRECREELGCEVDMYDELGQIVEYRKMSKLKQTSSCYVARVVGEKGTPSFTQEEIDSGFQIQWIPIEGALEMLRSDEPLNDEGRMYIVPRDTAFIQEAINL